MSSCLKICKEIIEAGKKATGRPWRHKASDDAHSVVSVPTKQRIAHGIFVDDADYIALAANNADRLARVLLSLKAEMDIEDSFIGGTGQIVSAAISRLWDESAEPPKPRGGGA